MSCWRGPRFARRIWKGGGGRVGKGALIEIGCCRFRQTLNVPKSGKPDFGARRAHQAAAFGGHAEPVIGPAQRVRPLAGPMAGSGRTRWLCPPYGASIRPKLAVARSTFRPLLDSGLLAPTPCRAGFWKTPYQPCLAFQQTTSSLASSRVASRHRSSTTSWPIAFSVILFSSTL